MDHGGEVREAEALAKATAWSRRDRLELRLVIAAAATSLVLWLLLLVPQALAHEASERAHAETIRECILARVQDPWVTPVQRHRLLQRAEGLSVLIEEIDRPDKARGGRAKSSSGFNAAHERGFVHWEIDKACGVGA